MKSTGSPAADQAIAGFAAGATATVLLHPLDLVKTRLQVDRSASQQPLAGRMLRAFRAILREGRGPRALWQGLSPNFAGASVAWTMYFWCYHHAKTALAARHDAPRPLTAGEHLAAAAVSGAATCVVTNPLWVVKTRMCLQDARAPGAYTGVASALVRIARTEGLAGLYSGFVPALFGVSHGAVQFVVYEELKRLVSADGTPPTAVCVGLAAASKMAASACTYPYQVVKSRLQASSAAASLGVVRVIADTFRAESFWGFYAGLGPNLVRVLPGTMITFGVYEALSGAFRRQRDFSSSATAEASEIAD